MNLDDLKKQACEQTQYWIDLANELYGLNLDYPCISFKLRGRTAGQARYFPGLSEIRYNAVLLQENGDRFLKRTVPHEVAHIVANCKHKYRVKPHGYEWKQVMKDFGVEYSRCHSYDTSNSRVRKVERKYEYKCRCRTFSFTIIRHRRAMKGAKYFCKSCKDILTPA